MVMASIFIELVHTTTAHPIHRAGISHCPLNPVHSLECSTLPKMLSETLRGFTLHILRPSTMIGGRLPFINLCGYADGLQCLKGRSRTRTQQAINPLGLHPPFRHQPICGESTLQRRRADPVLVDGVTARNCS